jgi:hypothetical protein
MSSMIAGTVGVPRCWAAARQRVLPAQMAPSAVAGMGRRQGKSGVGLDAADEVLEALVLDGARVPLRRVKAVERHGLHSEGFNLSRHLARARNMEGRRFRRLLWQRFHPPLPV